MKVEIPLRVMAFETDYGGVVSNTRYVEYLERGRYALLQAGGLKVSEMLIEHGSQFVVRRTEIDYLGAARHEDDLVLQTAIREHTGATTVIEHVLTRPADNAVLLRAVQVLAYLTPAWKPVRVPDAIRAAWPIEEMEPPRHQDTKGR